MVKLEDHASARRSMRNAVVAWRWQAISFINPSTPSEAAKPPKPVPFRVQDLTETQLGLS